MVAIEFMAMDRTGRERVVSIENEGRLVAEFHSAGGRPINDVLVQPNGSLRVTFTGAGSVLNAIVPPRAVIAFLEGE